jgi:serine/threonine protein phosphatase 1
MAVRWRSSSAPIEASRGHAMHTPIFSLRAQPKTPRHVFPAGRIGFAVGDIHGRADLLDRLLTQIEANGAGANERPTLVFAGDYIDRGRDSRAVLDILTSARACAFERRFLLGNHEQMLLDFLAHPASGRRWLQMGGMDTIASYGVRPPRPFAGDRELEDAACALRDAMPVSHLDFLQGLERFVEIGDCLFVHAGIDPKKPLKAQSDRDLLWIREPFLTYERRMSHRVVHGHTPVRTPSVSPERIAIDTGAYATGVLTAARLEGAGATFLTT